MTDAEARHAFETWRQRLVPEWELGLVFDDPSIEDSSRAHIRWSTDYHQGHVGLCRGWLDDEVYAEFLRPGQSMAFEREVDLVHELVHALLRDMEQVVKAACERMGNDVQNVHWKLWGHAQEGAVERLARAYVRSASVLPDKP